MADVTGVSSAGSDTAGQRAAGRALLMAVAFWWPERRWPA